MCSKQEVKHIDSYLEDTRHLLQLIEEENARGPQLPGTVPVTLDVKAMYNNVPSEQGLRAFKECMNKRTDKSIPMEFLVRVMRLIASSNIFEFDQSLFLQLLGVAMGSRSSPTFACLFMGMVEVFMLFEWHRVGGIDPHMWRRFIDDVFFVWRGTKEELQRYVDHLN